MSVEAYGLTDIGCVRQQNEDSFCTQDWPEHGLSMALVADGMGGYKGGAMASQLAVTTFLNCINQWLREVADSGQAINGELLQQQLQQASAAANQAIWQQRQQQPELAKMGTTLVALATWLQQAWIVNAGDSRCYRLHEGGSRLEQLTRDDKIVQQMIDSGAMTETEAKASPLQHILSKALGPEPEIEFSITETKIKPGDTFLLCSDGLYNCVDENDIIHTLTQPSPPRTAMQPAY